jgi:dihydroxyacetone kinase-like predicted kinase
MIMNAMNESLGFVTSAEVTIATRDVEIDGLKVRTGQHIGLLDGDLVVAGDDLVNVLADVLDQAIVDESELVTLIYGDTFDEAAARVVLDKLETQFGDLEFELVAGNQPLYPFIVSVE